MKREEKNALSRRRILDAALEEFSEKGFEGASLNAACAKNDLSKGLIYHYFKDKDELYLLCAEECFGRLSACVEGAMTSAAGDPEARLRAFFDARAGFFAENPGYLGIFLSVMEPPAHLEARVAEARSGFDDLCAGILTEMLRDAALRPGLSAAAIVEDFRMYMDFVNLRFQKTRRASESPEEALKKHEELCHRQIAILLYGALERPAAGTGSMEDGKER